MDSGGMRPEDDRFFEWQRQKEHAAQIMRLEQTITDLLIENEQLRSRIAEYEKERQHEG